MDKNKILSNKKLIWALILTSILVVSTFVSWGSFEATEGAFGKATFTLTGWNGNLSLAGIKVYNWLVCLASLSIAGLLLAAQLRLLEARFPYLIGQLVIIGFYLTAYLFLLFSEVEFELGPGILLLMLANVFLLKLYLEERRRK